MLQGSLEDFALEEILSLLADTSKSGQLDINGDRGSGALTIRAGKLADAQASECDSTAEPEDVMFEMLRFSEGSFVFSNQESEPTGDEKDISGVLSVAENRLADWKSIAAVVPSLQHIVVPSSELPQDEVTIDRSEWSVLVIVANGIRTGEMCDTLELGEVEGCRKIKHLIERGLLELHNPSSSVAPDGMPSTEETVETSALKPPISDSEVGVLTTPEVNSVAGNDSLVTSLRGGATELTEGMPPIPSPNHHSSVATADPRTEGAVEGEGLLMRYLRGEDN